MDHNDAQPPGTIRVFLADDNLIVREGVRALIDRHADLEVVGVAADYDEAVSGRHRRQPAGAGHRHPDAAVLPARGHRRGQGGPQAPPRHRGRDPVAVRRPRVRGLAAGGRLGRLRATC